MGRWEAADDRSSEDADELREVIPARAVLTELARGFLLVRDSSPDRAARFAATFLREQTGTAGAAPRTEPASKVTLARLSLGRLPRGAVEPTFGPATR
jgi:hypothetical protein